MCPSAQWVISVGVASTVMTSRLVPTARVEMSSRWRDRDYLPGVS